MVFRKNLCSYISQRWVTTFVCFFGLLNMYSMRICLSIALTEMVVPIEQTSDYVDDTCPSIEKEVHENKTVTNKHLYEWSEYTQGVILSSFYWAYTLSNFMGGVLAVKFGGKHVLGIGILSTGVLTILTPAAVTWGGAKALILLRVIMGFGEGVTYPALSALMSRWIPEDEVSKAGSIIFSGASLGTIFGNTLSGVMLQYSDIGWPIVFYFYGGMGCLSFALNWAFCYSKPSENPFISDEETDYLKEKIKNTHDDLPPTPWCHIFRSKPFWALVALMTGNSWGFMTMVSDMPKFMSSVLKFSVEKNGYLSSLPHLAFWITSTVTSFIADSLIASERMSIENVRKVGATLATMGPAIFLISASYAGCDRVLTVVLITIGLGLMGCATFSILVNSLDLAPNYAGSLMGLVNGISMLSGILTPYVVGVLTPHQTISEWHLVFWIMFAVFVFANVVFLIWGTAKLQDWNDPVFLMGDKKISNDKNIELSKI